MIRSCIAAFLLLLTGCATFDLGAPRAALADEELRSALSDLLCQVEPSCQRIRLYVLDREFPQAEMFPDGRLLINIGMLTATRSESEIAFVLAHESAHRRLGHLLGPDAEARANTEMQADAFAIERLRASGLQPGAGYQLLVRLLMISRADARREVPPKNSAGGDSKSGSGKDDEAAAAVRQQALQEGLEQLEQRIRAMKRSVGSDADIPDTAGDQLWQQRLLPYQSERAID